MVNTWTMINYQGLVPLCRKYERMYIFCICWYPFSLLSDTYFVPLKVCILKLTFIVDGIDDMHRIGRKEVLLAPHIDVFRMRREATANMVTDLLYKASE